jgi:hypothetical protein
MFAKLAQFGRFGRTHKAGIVFRSSNDGHLLRLAASRRPPRRVLACRWRKTPTGGLECVWGIERTEVTAVPQESQIGRPNGSLSALLRAA